LIECVFIAAALRCFDDYLNVFFAAIAESGGVETDLRDFFFSVFSQLET